MVYPKEFRKPCGALLMARACDQSLTMSTSCLKRASIRVYCKRSWDRYTGISFWMEMSAEIPVAGSLSLIMGILALCSA
eukprot:CAMPEP_0114176814 /NCGR_PEP_ID=MMETSP0043_2-20121206/37690_1 /TAXON_ID=464988 /ORGANISM="Hemiselmis andersenii, Strain CCMP644" /LENGTH=78 /DNA_ID=CAMNT_0001275143 /DNA_START=133 /DNA_END=369 /DNA_ORIENTATION=-